jgi:carbamoyltransferase
MTNKRFERLFGRGPRQAEAEITPMDMDLARSVQEVTEEVVMKIVTALRREYGENNLCLAGGVALNSVANGKLLRAGVFDKLWIQPAAGDAGGAIGAALACYHLHREQPRRPHRGRDGMNGAYLGPDYSDDAIKRALDTCGAVCRSLSEDELIEQAAAALTAERVIGWFQGRMEFGPRALGARSILGDPRSPHTQSVMNLKIKFRESFRPFAPSVLREDVAEYFDLEGDSPYMLLVAPVRAARRRESAKGAEKMGLERVNLVRSDIPAVTHVDYSARIQTVHADSHPLYHRLIAKFKEMTGYGLVVNTSFNVRGEPIVCTPADAFRCFMSTALDELYIGSYRLMKDEQKGARSYAAEKRR